MTPTWWRALSYLAVIEFCCAAGACNDAVLITHNPVEREALMTRIQEELQ